MIIKREDIALVVQLLASMKEAVVKMDGAFKAEDAEKLSTAKAEITKFQKRISELL